jgi:hypothetical protein
MSTSDLKYFPFTKNSLIYLTAIVIGSIIITLTLSSGLYSSISLKHLEPTDVSHMTDYGCYVAKDGYTVPDVIYKANDAWMPNVGGGRNAWCIENQKGVDITNQVTQQYLALHPAKWNTECEHQDYIIKTYAPLSPFNSLYDAQVQEAIGYFNSKCSGGSQ